MASIIYLFRRLFPSSQTSRYDLPMDVPEKSFNVIGLLQPIIDQIGMFKDIQDQEGCVTSRMPYIMLIDPEIKESSCERILIQNGSNPPLTSSRWL
jgi:hypothetical protein